jgi:hypothetical protein
MLGNFLAWYVQSVAAQVSTGVLIIVALCVAAYLLPPFRKWLLGAAGIVAAFLFAYAKGARDQKRAADRKNEVNVKRVEEKYDKIDRQPDDPGGGVDRMRRGDF